MSLLSSITKEAPNLPSRVVLYAPEKSGKTSFGCHAPEPIFLMTAGETGLLSLIESGQVPPTAHFPEDFKSWTSLVGAVQSLIKEKHTFKTLVLDTGNGAENMLASSVCAESFDGNWAQYQDYGRGIRLAVPQWAAFLAQLDTLRTERRMGIIFLHHAAVKQTANPTGKDWDQHRPEAIDKMWGLTHKWADVIAYYGVKVTVDRDDKATGEKRYLRCAPSAAIVAGNRYGLPDEITAQPGAAHLWKAFATEMVKAKQKAPQAQAAKPSTPPAAPQEPPKTPPPATKLATLDAERKRTGWAWPRCVEQLNSMFPTRPVKYDATTRFGDIEPDAVDALITHLKLQPDAKA